MKKPLFPLILVLLILSMSCTQSKVILQPLELPASELYVNDDETATLERIKNKYIQCSEGSYQNTFTLHPKYLSVFSTFGKRDYYAKRVNSESIKINAYPAFDTLHKKEAVLFKMGVLGEEGCPK